VPQFLADVAALAAIGPSEFTRDCSLGLATLAPTAIQDHLSLRVG
jgi:hypothetical protein